MKQKVVYDLINKLTLASQQRNFGIILFHFLAEQAMYIYIVYIYIKLI